MDLEHKRVVVIGLGRSGRSAATLCHAKGARVLGIDASPDPGSLDEFMRLGIETSLGDASAERARQADLVVVSPGVPRLPVLSECERRGIPVIGELELGCSFATAPVLAVGGTNGKSTTTKLCAEMLGASGFSAFIGGNYGTPVCDAVGHPFDVLVLEVSSFQLECAPTFRPRVSILLNISEDHLDRYRSFADYAAAKGNAFVNQTEGDVAVVELGDTACHVQASRGAGRIVTYSSEALEADYRLESTCLVESATGHRLDLGTTRLHGRHNWLNAAAAVAAVRAFHVEWDAISQAALCFLPLAHRMSRVSSRGGVNYYDDSKGTNVGAAVTALLGLAEARAVLIAGGRDKQGSYEPLVAALRLRGRALVVIGEARDRIADAARGVLPIARAASMEEAVGVASQLAEPGDAVLLSPACSSFDMYRSYAERGDDFQRVVMALPG